METSTSLLERLRSSPDSAAWGQLVELYTPLIRVWLRRYSSSQQDADDVVQEVLSVLVRKLPGFERERAGSFRSWLRSITVNCLRDSWRANRIRPPGTGGSEFREVLEQMADPKSQLSQHWNNQHDEHILKVLLEQIRPTLTEETWQAFKQVSIDGKTPAAVANSLEISVNAVYIAKSRVMSRIRALGRGLIE